MLLVDRVFIVAAVQCVTSQGEELPKQMCISELGNMPDITSTCHVECRHNDCLLSDWSEWSACHGMCGGHRYRHRSRDISKGGGALSSRCNLTRLREDEPCPPCSRFFPQSVGVWSTCILHTDPPSLAPTPHPQTPTASDVIGVGFQRGNPEVCGVGVRYHAQICTDGQGRNTSASNCGFPGT